MRPHQRNIWRHHVDHPGEEPTLFILLKTGEGRGGLIIIRKIQNLKAATTSKNATYSISIVALLYGFVWVRFCMGLLL